MIYYLILLVTGIAIDFNDLKNSNSKADIIFYIVSIILCISLGLLYFKNINNEGIAEWVIQLFGLGGM